MFPPGSRLTGYSWSGENVLPADSFNFVVPTGILDSMRVPPHPVPPEPARESFVTTAWSVVLRAASDAPEAKQALQELCCSYWYPLYAWLRRGGNSPHDAEDTIQGFFASLLENNAIRYADPNRGRFRSFLLASLRRFMSRQQEHSTAAKRGGGRPLLSIDTGTGEERYRHEPADTLTADKLYDYLWALSVIQRVIDRLQAEHAAAGKQVLFEALQGCLTYQQQVDAVAIARQLGMSEGAVRVAIHRLRRRFADALRGEVSQTIDSPEAVADELRSLMSALQL